MVRKVDIATTLDCSAEQLWHAVYAEPGPTQRYHARVNKDPAARVTSWKEGVRLVTFCMPLNAPDWVKRLVNIDVVRVQETQTVIWSSAHSFHVKSETTVLNVPGASRFTTVLSLAVAQRSEATNLHGQGNTNNDGDATAAGEDGNALYCDVTFTVRVAAGMPWPLAASIENIMAEKASQSMQDYIDFCRNLIDEHLNNLAAGNAAPDNAPAALPGGSHRRSYTSDAVLMQQSTIQEEVEGVEQQEEGASQKQNDQAPAQQQQDDSVLHSSPMLLDDVNEARRVSTSETLQGMAARRSSRLHHSMLISTFSQNVDDMMMPSDSMLNMAQHAQQQQDAAYAVPTSNGESSKGRSDDDGDKWLSPAPSFSASLSGYTSENEGAVTTRRLSTGTVLPAQQPGTHSHQQEQQQHILGHTRSALTAGTQGLSDAAVALALQSLAGAVQGLERKMTQFMNDTYAMRTAAVDIARLPTLALPGDQDESGDTIMAAGNADGLLGISGEDGEGRAGAGQEAAGPINNWPPLNPELVTQSLQALQRARCRQQYDSMRRAGSSLQHASHVEDLTVPLLSGMKRNTSGLSNYQSIPNSENAYDIEGQRRISLRSRTRCCSRHHVCVAVKFVARVTVLLLAGAGLYFLVSHLVLSGHIHVPWWPTIDDGSDDNSPASA